MEDLRKTEGIPKAVLQDYQSLLASQPSRRLNPSKLAESSVLKNKLVDTIAFLENLAVKDSIDKDNFFKRLPGTLPSLPVPVAQRKLLPMIAQALEYGGAPAVALGMASTCPIEARALSSLTSTYVLCMFLAPCAMDLTLHFVSCKDIGHAAFDKSSFVLGGHSCWYCRHFLANWKDA
jgi:hypothetical protein